MGRRTSSGQVREIDVVMAGGGALGIAYVGALRALQDHGLWPVRVAGTSAGSLVGALVAAGYNATELEWLLASPDTHTPRPDSLPRSITQPINLSTFLDPPRSSGDLSLATMRRTHLWKAIKLNAVDELFGKELKRLPTRGKLADELTDRVVGLSLGKFDPFRQRIRRVLDTALHFYPEETPAIRSFLPGTLEQLRTDIADAAWKAFTDAVTEYRLLVNWAFEGGLFEGRVLYETVKELIEAKLGDQTGEPVSPVRFKDLPMELAVTAANVSHPDRSKRLQIHTRLTAGNMEVAQAVRDSTSVPMFFRPSKYTETDTTFEIMDGGIICNYPFWLFTGGHEGYLHPKAVDHARPKLGLIVDPDLDAPPEWECPAPKWHRPGSTEGIPPHGTDALAQNPEFEFLSPEGPLGEFVGIERALRVVDIIVTSETTLTEQWRSAVRATYPYYEAFIPLRGFHWLDFTANADATTWRSMVDRGYEATKRVLIEAGLIPGSAERDNPYRA